MEYKVFKMNDFDWVASINKETAEKWYMKENDLAKEELETEECSLGQGMWVEYNNIEHIEQLENENTIEITVPIDGDIKRKGIGSIEKRFDEWWIKKTYEEVLKNYDWEKDGTFVIASTEY